MRYRMFAAFDDLAVVIHLAQSPFGVVLRARHDQDVLYPLTMLGFYVEAVTDHELPPLPVRPPSNRGPAPKRINALGLGAAMIGQIAHANNVPPSFFPSMIASDPLPPRLSMSHGESELIDSLRRMKIVSANQHIILTPLAGGVSSDI